MKELNDSTLKEAYVATYELMSEGVVLLNDQYKIVAMNAKGKQMLDYEGKEYIGKPYSILFKDERTCHQLFARLSLNEESNESVVKKYRKNGEALLTKLRIKELSNSSFRYIIVFTDITKQMDMKRPLALASQVFQHMNEGVMITNDQGRIIFVNPSFQKVTGYSEKEVIGEKPKILQSGIHDALFYSKMWDAILTKGFWQGEIWNKRKNGEVFPECLTISAIRNREGKVINFVGVFTDITVKKMTEKELKKLVHYDSLTGVVNRYSYMKRMESLIHTSRKYHQQLAVLYLDMDRFKQINDNLGHDAGDQLLIEVANRLKGLLKDKDIIARLGGDEFVITLANIKHPREPYLLSEKIIQVLNSPFWICNQEIYTSISIGISVFPDDGHSVGNLLRASDKAMYEAKSQGRNRFAVYHEKMKTNNNEQLKLEADLHKAVKRKEFHLVYQPQINLRTNRIEGVEALIRWNNRRKGAVPPGEFIPLAEDMGLIVPISDWVLKQVCHDFKKLHRLGFQKLRFGVNVSPLYFREEQFAENMIQITEKEKIPARFIDIELTESTIMPNATSSIHKLLQMKKHGFKISVDDFGTGYSSLSYLNRFPLDTLKIDQSFVKSICKFDEDSSIVEAIITMAHSLHLKVIAEGVENEKQLDFLKKEKCDFVQGYYFSKPLPLDDLIDFFYKWEAEWIK
ncbi:diguanylate cyclase (GGDEF)-like protein/PAS domain S-box-containing protein [Oikeobacillus pervagus]|uniref:Diguanylate cyclase (GGDEF)-like protein/PAS domain S-box-containing protein n=1 Tax=Oikeobacillus pervagus TaxID=1325931 RepID=A0AAJ1SW07_9BACI|nr:GGDEF and EAL domain-containing protein [Oikeobacillus pervagus]MDQ0213644.1 diguanylate cyclase (GGDEF)-like protein/PAS domain S-box-containing protein [Oikeobacillus pervagus]